MGGGGVRRMEERRIFKQLETVDRMLVELPAWSTFAPFHSGRIRIVVLLLFTLYCNALPVCRLSTNRHSANQCSAKRSDTYAAAICSCSSSGGGIVAAAAAAERNTLQHVRVSMINRQII